VIRDGSRSGELDAEALSTGVFHPMSAKALYLADGGGLQ
jgi:hypothetical protein